jgi:hypothetical protein
MSTARTPPLNPVSPTLNQKKKVKTKQHLHRSKCVENYLSPRQKINCPRSLFRKVSTQANVIAQK